MHGWLLNNVVIWSAYHCVRGTSSLCTLPASAFIEPSLCQLDFFLEIFFYGDLYSRKIDFKVIMAVLCSTTKFGIKLLFLLECAHAMLVMSLTEKSFS